MIKKYPLLVLVFIGLVRADNIGWKSYLVENPTEFHDIPLIWETGNLTKIPNWLSGIYVRNGPAQVCTLRTWWVGDTWLWCNISHF